MTPRPGRRGSRPPRRTPAPTYPAPCPNPPVPFGTYCTPSERTISCTTVAATSLTDGRSARGGVHPRRRRRSPARRCSNDGNYRPDGTTRSPSRQACRCARSTSISTTSRTCSSPPRATTSNGSLLCSGGPRHRPAARCRLDAFTGNEARLLEAIGAGALAADLQEPFSPALAEVLRGARRSPRRARARVRRGARPCATDARRVRLVLELEVGLQRVDLWRCSEHFDRDELRRRRSARPSPACCEPASATDDGSAAHPRRALRTTSPVTRSRRTTPRSPTGEGGTLARSTHVDEGPRRRRPGAAPARRAVVELPLPHDDPRPRGGRAPRSSRPTSSASAAPTSRRERTDYTYQRHVDWMRSVARSSSTSAASRWSCQDWGGLIGLRLVAEHARPVRPRRRGQHVPPHRRPSPRRRLPRLAEVLAGGPRPSRPAGSSTAAAPPTSPPEVIAAYDAPFPDESYKEGARQFPMLVPTAPDDPASERQRRGVGGARTRWTKPFLTAFSDSDPITAGADRVLQSDDPGRGRPAHTTIVGGGHFLQEDRGEELAAWSSTSSERHRQRVTPVGRATRPIAKT